MIFIGDVREALSNETQKNVINLIERRQDKKSYYLLIIANKRVAGSNDIKTSLVMTSTLPHRMFGSICLHVDNIKGKIERLWALPLDRPSVNFVDGKQNDFILHDAKGLPIYV